MGVFDSYFFKNIKKENKENKIMKKNLSVVILFAVLITAILGNGAPKIKEK